MYFFCEQRFDGLFFKEYKEVAEQGNCTFWNLCLGYQAYVASTTSILTMKFVDISSWFDVSTLHAYAFAKMLTAVSRVLGLR